MPRERTIPCSDCPEWKRDLERRGFAVQSCKPIPGTPGFCLLVFDEATPTARPRAIRRLAGVKGVGGRVEMSRSRGIPRRVFDLSTPPSNDPPRRIAQAPRAAGGHSLQSVRRRHAAAGAAVGPHAARPEQGAAK